MVVAVVKKVGLKRCWAALMMACNGQEEIKKIYLLHSLVNSISKRSINTMALLIIIPDSGITASVLKNPNIGCATIKPIETSINPSGIVKGFDPFIQFFI